LTANPVIFINKGPVAVLFGNERVSVKSWIDVYRLVLGRCNQEQVFHDRLMNLRGKVAGRVRLFLSENSDKLVRPIKIDDSLYAESHYGSQTMMSILTTRILSQIGYDCSNISLEIR